MSPRPRLNSSFSQLRACDKAGHLNPNGVACSARGGPTVSDPDLAQILAMARLKWLARTQSTTPWGSFNAAGSIKERSRLSRVLSNVPCFGRGFYPSRALIRPWLNIVAPMHILSNCYFVAGTAVRYSSLGYIIQWTTQHASPFLPFGKHVGFYSTSEHPF